MDRNFYNEEFEQFLKQKADQYKMYPSDRVWNNIDSSLHSRKRWYSLGLAAMIIFLALMVSRELLLSDFNRVAQQVDRSLSSAPPSPAALVSPSKENIARVLSFPRQQSRSHKSLNGQPANRLTIISITPLSAQTSQALAATETAGNNPVEGEAYSASGIGTYSSGMAADEPEGGMMGFNRSGLAKNQFSKKSLDIPGLGLPRSRSSVRHSEKKSYQNYFAALDISKPLESKWSLQLYASPIVSFRQLSIQGSSSAKFVPQTFNYTGSINDYVQQNPGIGFELGTKMQYKLTGALSVYAGAQLNYSRYYINAYNYQPALSGVNLATAQTGDTVAAVASLAASRSAGGNSDPVQLQNQYLQFSVPLGAELKVLGSRRLQFSIAASVQPTYLLSSNTFLISSDFKNYVQNSDLSRRFNIHTNVEAFISYKIGGLKWQLGPQFRYQVLSSFSNQYPIREYLTEFGFKLGVTKTIW